MHAIVIQFNGVSRIYKVRGGVADVARAKLRLQCQPRIIPKRCETKELHPPDLATSPPPSHVNPAVAGVGVALRRVCILEYSIPSVLYNFGPDNCVRTFAQERK